METLVSPKKLEEALNVEEGIRLALEKINALLNDEKTGADVIVVAVCGDGRENTGKTYVSGILMTELILADISVSYCSGIDTFSTLPIFSDNSSKRKVFLFAAENAYYNESSRAKLDEKVRDKFKQYGSTDRVTGVNMVIAVCTEEESFTMPVICDFLIENKIPPDKLKKTGKLSWTKNPND